MAIRYILFDAVGTLLYPQPSVAQAYLQAAQRHDVSISLEDIKSRFPVAYREAFRNGGDFATDEDRERQRWRTVVDAVFRAAPPAIDALLDQLWHEFSLPQRWPLFDDVVSAWANLTARGYVLGIASNFDSRLRNILTGHSCLADCRQVFVSTELGWSKPSEFFYRSIQERLGAQPDEILMVGDDFENDVVAPRRAGWRSLELDRRSADPEVVKSLHELANFIDRLP
jgi:putative hydrolase of the HAD superfamily